MKTIYYTIGRLWGGGALLFCLRLVQDRTGFDPDTGLALPSAAGTAAVVCLAALAALELVLARRQVRQRVSFTAHFAPPGQRALTALAVGCMLLAAGGCLLALDGVTNGSGVAPVVTGLLAVATAGGLLLLTKQVRAGEAPGVAPMLPAMFFGVFLVLAVYLPAADDPVLQRFYLPLLAAAMTAYAFSQLAGFLRRESRPRSFTPIADLAVVLCLAAMADGGRALVLLFAGCALVLTVFRVLQRPRDLPEPETEEEAPEEAGREA